LRHCALPAGREIGTKSRVSNDERWLPEVPVKAEKAKIFKRLFRIVSCRSDLLTVSYFCVRSVSIVCTPYVHWSLTGRIVFFAAISLRSAICVSSVSILSAN
jgi:hypothetical protein